MTVSPFPESPRISVDGQESLGGLALYPIWPVIFDQPADIRADSEAVFECKLVGIGAVVEGTGLIVEIGQILHI